MTTAGSPQPQGIEVRPVDGAEISSFLNVFETAWASGTDEGQRRPTRFALTGERTLGAYVRGGMAGTAMSFSMELSLPGWVQVPMAGVSYVAVHPLYRRRGIMRALMRHQIDDLHARDISLAGLGASEAGIYSRFGYGPATWDSSWRLARGAVRDLAGRGDPSTLELVEAQVARKLFPTIHEEARRSQVGEVRTYPARWDDLIGRGRCFTLCRSHDGHPSGYAIYRIERQGRYSSHATAVVDHLITSTDAAYRSLWAYLADLDLTDWVTASGRPEHEPLYWTLPDRRQLTITAVSDHLWIRLIDLAEALTRRRYAVEDSLVLDVTDRFCPWNAGRWLLAGGPGGAECHRAGDQDRAGLRLDASALASLFLGGVSVARLATAGRVTADVATLRRAHLMFRTDQDPWCSTEF
jgi:predicted acetyltransferase